MSKIQLCDLTKCTQCMACVNTCPKGCITMVDARDGFCIPYIDCDACAECGACMRACHEIESHVEFNQPLHTLACWTKNDNDRKKSSSGGAFSVLARKVLSIGGVVFGATMDNKLKVRHICIDKAEDIRRLQGSKYVQSYLGDTYKQVREYLKADRQVLFTGTPCQVAGLLTFLKHRYDNLITCDFVCHGVPSQKAFDIYIDKIGLKNRCCGFSFRFTKGWGFQLSYITKNRNNNVKKIIYPKKTYYLKAFTKGLMFSEACYSCLYTQPNRVSDFTMADYWGIGVDKPFNHSTKHGISLLLVNNSKSLNFLADCSDLVFEERSLKEAINGNYNLSHTSSRPLGRDSYFNDSISLSVKELCDKYDIKASFNDYLRIIKQLKNSYF